MIADVREIKRFADAAALFEQVGETSADDDETIAVITTLAEHGEWSAIDVLYINGGKNVVAEFMLESTFNITIDKLNELADEFGYERVK